MSETFFLEVDCVSGEKLIFHRSAEPNALVEVTVDAHGERTKVQVKPLAFLTAVMMAKEHLS